MYLDAEKSAAAFGLWRFAHKPHFVIARRGFLYLDAEKSAAAFGLWRFAQKPPLVIARRPSGRRGNPSRAQSRLINGLLRRSAPRNDEFYSEKA